MYISGDDSGAADPDVSVITPVYNGSDYLGDLFESLDRQRFIKVQHIVIDDGSTDDGATCRLLENRKGLAWRSRGNRGQYATINEGLAMAKGEFVVIISADDYFYNENSLRRAVEWLRSHPAYAGVYGKTQYVNRGKEPLSVQPLHRVCRCFLPYVFAIAHCSFIVRRRVLVENGYYWPENRRYVGDAEWILRIIDSGNLVGSIGNIISCYRIHPGQLSGKGEALSKIAEHLSFDKENGVDSRVDAIVRALLTLRCRLIELYHFVRYRKIVR